MMFRVAQAANCSLDDIRNMSVEDYNDWCAFCIVEPKDGVTQAIYLGSIIAELRNLKYGGNDKYTPITAKDVFRSASEELPEYYRNELDQKIYEDKVNEKALADLMDSLR